ncbi:MAG TPA: hypothetical protein VLB44_00865 [Kofleriaceae bacterium]|nr:hypothetical protein [Kofleriaceae bacterium]
MTSRKDPPKSAEPPGPPASEAAKRPLEVFTEVIAHAIGQLRGLPGPDVATAVSGVQRDLQRLMTSIGQKANDPATRESGTAEVEKLIELFTKTGVELAGALVAYREPAMTALQSVDMEKTAGALRKLADWIKNPTPESKAELEKVVGELEATMAVVGGDREAGDRKRREELKAEVKASLDEIFPGKRKPTT